MTWLILQTLGSLLLVLLLMVGVVYALKRWFMGPQGHFRSAVEIEVLAHRMLQPKKSVYVIRVLDKTMVVGLSENGFQSLASVNYDEIDEEISDALLSNTAIATPTFLNYLKENLGIVRQKSALRTSRSKNNPKS